MIKHFGPISGIASSKKYVATAGYDNQVILWDRQSKIAIQRGLHDHLANRCQISKDEKYLVSASSDYSARLWKLPEMQLMTVFSGHEDDVESAQFSPCGNLIVTSSQDRLLRIFNLNGQLIHTLKGHTASVYTCAWSQDGKTIVSSSDDATIRTWCTQTGQCLSVNSFEEVQTDAVAITRKGVVYAGNDNGELVRIVGEEMTTLKIHLSGIKNIIINESAQVLISLSYDKTLGIIDISNGMSLLRQIKVPSAIWARSAAFLDPYNIAFATFGSSYATLSLPTETWSLEGIGITNGINGILVTEDHVYSVGDAGVIKTHNDNHAQITGSVGSLCNFITQYKGDLICGGHMGVVFNAKTGRPLIELKCPINKAIPVDDFLVTALYTGEIAVMTKDKNNQYVLVGEYKVLKNAVKDISSSGSLLFCVGAAGDAAYFDLSLMKRTKYIEAAHTTIVNSSTLVKNQLFATVGRDRRLNLWEENRRIASVETPHDHSIKCVTASGDGKYIACGSYDGKVAIYDTDTKSWRKLVKVTAAGISSIKFGRNTFWASSYDGHIYAVTA